MAQGQEPNGASGPISSPVVERDPEARPRPDDSGVAVTPAETSDGVGTVSRRDPPPDLAAEGPSTEKVQVLPPRPEAVSTPDDDPWDEATVAETRPDGEAGAAQAQDPGAPDAELEVDDAASGSAAQAAWLRRVEVYTAEADALGAAAAAAPVHLEIGRIYEERLGKPREAAAAYQTAFNLDRGNPSVLHASRRLFASRGNWAMVAEILGYEIERATSEANRATLLAERGMLYERQLDDADAAREAYEAALAAWAAEPIALAALERIYLFERDYAALLSVYQRALDVTVEPRHRVPLLIAAAHVAEDRLERPAEAIELLRQVLEVERGHAIALSSLRRLYRETGDEEGLLEVLERTAEVTEDPLDATHHYRAAARLSERRGRSETALRLLERALERAPDDVSSLREAELAFTRAGRPDDAERFGRRAAQAASEPVQTAAALYRIASAAELRGDLEGALVAARDALSADPEFTPATQVMGRCLEGLDRPQELAALYEQEIARESDPREKLTRWYKLSELRERRLGDPAGAIEACRRALELDRSDQPARERLERLLVAAGATDELVRLFEEEVELTTDPQLQIFLLGRIGTLAEDELADLPRARAAMDRLLALAPRHLGAIRALGRLAEKEGDPAALVRALELEAEATEDQPAVLALMHRQAQVRLEALDDEEGARTVLEQVLSLNPTHLPALRTLGRIHARAGRWAALLEMHRRELEVTRSPRRKVDLMFRVAQLHERRAGDLEASAETYEALLEVDPDNEAALRALGDLYARLDRPEALARVREAELERIQDPAARASALVELAELYEDRLDRGDRAVELYQQAIKVGHGVEPATRGLVRVLSREGMWNALAAALRTAAERAKDPRAEASILLRAAHVEGHKLKNLEAASELLHRAARLRPDDVQLLHEVERMAMARRDWEGASEAAGRVAALEPEPRARAARRLMLAFESEPLAAMDHYRAALEAQPDHPIALRALETAYLGARDWANLAQLYVLEAEARPSEDGHRATLLTRAAELHEVHLGQADEARRLYAAALEANPDHLPAIRGWREIVADGPEALDLLRREGELTTDPSRAAELLVETGRMLLEREGDVDGAAACFEQVLTQDPAHLGAFNQLEAILLEREDYPRLEALLSTRAHSVDRPEERARLLVAAGRIAGERLGEQERAISAFRAALRAEPDSVAAMVRLGPILYQRADWDGALEIFHRVLQASQEPEILRDTYKSVGIIYQEHRKDLVKSVQAFQAALRADPSDTECLHRLSAVYRGARDWGSAANVMLRLAEVEPTPAGKTHALLDLADVYLEGNNDEPHAISALRKAVEIDPRCAPALERLCALHRRRGEWTEFVEAAGAFVNQLSPQERHRATPLHLDVAEVFERKLGDDQRAINALRYALEASPGEPDALERLAGLYGKKAETYPQAVEVHRQLIASDPFRFGSWHELFRLFERLGQHDRAFVVAEVLVFFQAQTPDELVFHRENKGFVAQMSDGVLTPQEHMEWVVHPEEAGPIRQVLEVLAPEIGRTLPPPESASVREGKLGPRSGSPMRALADELAEMLGGVPFELWQGAPEEVSVTVESDRPPALIVGGRFAKRMPARDQRFRMGRALERIKGGHFLFDLAADRELEALLWGVVTMVAPDQPVPVDPAALDAAQRRLRALSARSRRALDELGGLLLGRHLALSRHRAVAQLTANRAGLVAANDIEAALRDIARRSGVQTGFTDARSAAETLGQVAEIRDLLAFAVSEGYLESRVKLGFSIQA